MDESRHKYSPWIFPDPEAAGEDGLLAMGGDLKLSTLLKAYSREYFLGIQKKHRFCGGAPIRGWSFTRTS
jgi:hypothetical protein